MKKKNQPTEGRPQAEQHENHADELSDDRMEQVTGGASFQSKGGGAKNGVGVEELTIVHEHIERNR